MRRPCLYRRAGGIFVADVITLGEAMITMTPVQRGPLRFAGTFQRGMGGAEANFAIGAARLGCSVRYLSRLGDDEFGRYILRELRGEGVDVERVPLVPGGVTGLNIKEVKETGDGRTFYYRAGSAASFMGADDVTEADFAGARWLHVSGVFPAVSESCRAATFRAVALARAAGCKVAVDPNIRLRLWDEATARQVLLDLLAQADYAFPGDEEGRILFGTSDPDEIAARTLALGPSVAVVKQGAAGATGHTRDGLRVHVAAFAVRAVDTVGAGDGWAAGFTAGALRGMDLAECMRLGNAVGAMVCSVSGDTEGLPLWDEVQAYLGKGPAPVER